MNVSLYKWQKVRWFQFENAPKVFGGRAPSGPFGGWQRSPGGPDLAVF